ncbi:hypothetical protein [Photobacterium damselae]|uniref:hypothetical protein n=1 Tax=Photobacterium damselae TaxID=38293 RepID=UPI004067F549
MNKKSPFLDTDLESNKTAIFIPVLSPKGTLGLQSPVWYYIAISAEKLILCCNSFVCLDVPTPLDDIINGMERTDNGWKYLTNNFALTVFSNETGVAVIVDCNGRRYELQRTWKSLLSSNIDTESALGADDFRICAKMKKHFKAPKNLITIGGMITRILGTWTVIDKLKDFEHTPANSYRNRNILDFLSGKQNKAFFKYECTDLPVIEIVTANHERTGEVFETFPNEINDLTLLSSKLMLGFS